jgi:outer membrane lipopolysaccharide assembly protein LptE/RlpB
MAVVVSMHFGKHWFLRAGAMLPAHVYRFSSSDSLYNHSGNTGKGGVVRTALLSLYLLFFLALFSGCGYHSISQDTLGHFGESATVSIPIFSNKTYKPNLENILLNNLIGEFAKRKGLQVVQSGDSDYTLSGELLTYEKNAVSYTGLDIVKEYTATLFIAATLRKNSNQMVIWKGRLSWSQDFPASSDIAIQQNSEDAAIQILCQRLAQQLYLKINEDF